MPSLCCFWDPKKEYSQRALTDLCVDCGRPYGYPLVHPPTRIGEYEIVGVVDRGFYGAIYVGERGFLRQKSVLKVVPKRVYEAFGKDFYEECRVHAEVASGTQHLVDIRDAFDSDVTFAGEAEPLPCHVAVLAFVDGQPLREFLHDDSALTATSIAQIASDLFRLLIELENKRRFHNDLHGGTERERVSKERFSGWTRQIANPAAGRLPGRSHPRLQRLDPARRAGGARRCRT